MATGKPRDPFQRKALATTGSEGPKGKNRPMPGRKRVTNAAEGPKKRMINPSKPGPKARGEGTRAPAKRSALEMAYANREGSEGPKSRMARGRTTRLGSEGPKKNPAVTRRQEQNRGVKGGTMRRGAGGKTMRKYNASTGRWEVVGILGKNK